ncbi:MAG TPA: RDD family protein [Pyrinomonadaceae bacterium]
MQCPSCGAVSDDLYCCTDLGAEFNENQESTAESADSVHELIMNAAIDVPAQPKKSTLIEFPGVNRTPVPEWRRELSERVREVQERRAREAAEANQAVAETADTENGTPQLELLPPAEVPEMNPLVAAALKRIERAHQVSTPEVRQSRHVLATAIAYAPAREEHEPEVSPVQTPQLNFETEVEPEFLVSEENDGPAQVEKSHNLVVVTVAEETEVIVEEEKPEPPTPKRLIVDDPNDPALNYLDSISRTVRVDEINSRRPAAFRRLVCALLDLIICAAICTPIAFAMQATGTNLQDIRAIEVLAGSLVVITFIYLTLTTALTGRTLAMRLLSLRIIDIKTGLIPTGGQAVARSILYVLSLAAAGLGIVYALVSREGYTAHDQITRTAVILI